MGGEPAFQPFVPVLLGEDQGYVGRCHSLGCRSKGYAFSDCERLGVWFNVREPLMRWVQLESAKNKTGGFMGIHCEDMSYFCFSCGFIGYAEAMCSTPAGRDGLGRTLYRESLWYMLYQNKIWGHAPASYEGQQSFCKGKKRPADEEDQVDKGEVANSPEKSGQNRVQLTVYQFNSWERGRFGLGKGCGNKRDVDRKIRGVLSS